jgi:type I restriction enzyme S subunit
LTARGGGTNISNLNQDILSVLEVPAPARAVQERIAGILAAYDELIENNQRRTQILEEMAQALYREWFVEYRFPGDAKRSFVQSSLGRVPATWEMGKLEDVVVLQRGFDLPKGDRVHGPVPIYAATGITGFHNEIKADAPGIVTGRSGTIGEVLYVQEDYWPLNTTLWSKVFPKAEPLYAYYLLRELDLKQFNSGAAVPTLNRNDIHGIEVLIPPRPLQEHFQKVAGGILALARGLERQNGNLRRTRDFLLQRLLSGVLH